LFLTSLALLCFLGLPVSLLFLLALRFFASFLFLLLLTLLPLGFGLPLALFLGTPLFLGFFASTLILLCFAFGFALLSLLLALNPLLLQLLLVRSLRGGFLGCFLCITASLFLFLGLLLEALLVLLFLRLSSLFGVPLLLSVLLFQEFFNELLLSLLGDLLSICRHDSLFKHSSGKDLKHSSPFLHALLFSHSILVTAVSHQSLFRTVPMATHHLVLIEFFFLLTIVIIIIFVVVVFVIERSMVMTGMERLVGCGDVVLRIFFSLHAAFG
jgi:hypothetical protein